MNQDQLSDQIAALFRSSPGTGRLGDEPPGTIADAVLGVVAPLLADRDNVTAMWQQIARNQLVAWHRYYKAVEGERDVAEGKALVEVEKLERELAAADDVEEKVECPGEMCAYSFVGEERAQQLIDHFLRDHAASHGPQCSVHPEGGETDG